MLKAVAAWIRRSALASVALVVAAGAALAQSAPAPTSTVPDSDQDRESRRACAILVCPSFYSHAPASGLVACNLQKTFRREALASMLGSPPWPWGDVQCRSIVRFDRAQLAKAAQEPSFDVQLAPQDISCQIEVGQSRAAFAVRLRPKIAFKDGKAVAADLEWGGFLTRPRVRKALWAPAAAYDLHGFLQRTVVDDINELIGTTCMEAREAWQVK